MHQKLFKQEFAYIIMLIKLSKKLARNRSDI